MIENLATVQVQLRQSASDHDGTHAQAACGPVVSFLGTLNGLVADNDATGQVKLPFVPVEQDLQDCRAFCLALAEMGEIDNMKVPRSEPDVLVCTPLAVCPAEDDVSADTDQTAQPLPITAPEQTAVYVPDHQIVTEAGASLSGVERGSPDPNGVEPGSGKSGTKDAEKQILTHSARVPALSGSTRLDPEAGAPSATDVQEQTHIRQNRSGVALQGQKTTDNVLSRPVAPASASSDVPRSFSPVPRGTASLAVPFPVVTDGAAGTDLQSASLGVSASSASAPVSVPPTAPAPAPVLLRVSNWPAALVAGPVVALLDIAGGSMVLDIAPEELGRLTISLSIQGEAATVRFQAETPEAVRLLAESERQLASELARFGMTLAGHEASADRQQAGRLEEQQTGLSHDDQSFSEASAVPPVVSGLVNLLA